jgi:hypothetical protein
MPKPSKPSSNDSTPPSSSKKPPSASEKPSAPSSSAESACSTGSPGPLAEREPLPDWLSSQHGETFKEEEPQPTGSATSSESSPEPSEASTNVWKPLSGELTVPPELIPEFIRTQIDLALQILQQDMEQMNDLLNATPQSEWLLRHTLTMQKTVLELTRLSLLGILFRNQEPEPNLLVPDPTLIGSDGNPLRKGPVA